MSEVPRGRQLSAAQRHAARLRAAAGSVGTGSDTETMSFINSDDDDDDDDASKFSATTETTEQSSKYGRLRQRRRRHHMPVMTRVNFHLI
jgi:Dishevelled specific domain